MFRDLAGKIPNPGRPPDGLVRRTAVRVRPTILRHPSRVAGTNDPPPVQPELGPRPPAAVRSPHQSIALALQSPDIIVRQPVPHVAQATSRNRKHITPLREPRTRLQPTTLYGRFGHAQDLQDTLKRAKPTAAANECRGRPQETAPSSAQEPGAVDARDGTSRAGQPPRRSRLAQDAIPLPLVNSRPQPRVRSEKSGPETTPTGTRMCPRMSVWSRSARRPGLIDRGDGEQTRGKPVDAASLMVPGPRRRAARTSPAAFR